MNIEVLQSFNSCIKANQNAIANIQAVNEGIREGMTECIALINSINNRHDLKEYTFELGGGEQRSYELSITKSVWSDTCSVTLTIRIPSDELLGMNFNSYGALEYNASSIDPKDMIQTTVLTMMINKSMRFDLYIQAPLEQEDFNLLQSMGKIYMHKESHTNTTEELVSTC